MSTSNIKDRPPLLPERRPAPDFFLCDLMDAAPKGDMASMEHPIFSLSTKPDHRIRRYEHGSTYVEIKPSSDGLATVHDRDVLIYCISQLMAGINDGQEVSSVVRFKAYDLLKVTNRMTNGQGYEALKAAFEKKKGTFYFKCRLGSVTLPPCQEHRARHRVDTFIMSSIEEMVEPMFSTKTMTLPPLSH